MLVSDPALFAGQLYSLEMVKVEGFTEGEFWYWTDDAENQSKPALRVRVIRVAARAQNDVGWSPTFWTPRLAGGIGGSIYRMRWESECFFRTYKRVVKDVRLVSRTGHGRAKPRIPCGVPALLGQGAWP